VAHYKIILDGLKGYGVEITSRGQFLSVRGFPTEVAAAAWIEEQKALSAAAAAIPAPEPST
jgi:hypothetical protein